MQTSCYGWKACARLAAAQPQPQSQSQLLRRAVRQSDGRVARRSKEGRERRTSKDPKHAQSEDVRPGRQSAVVVEIGCETVSHGITITTHTNTRAHTNTHTHSHSNIEAQPQLKSFYCPQHKRAQCASVSEQESKSGRANTHTTAHT